jgi:hypothetical protein
MLKVSKLKQHDIYFFQSKFGVQWMMPIRENGDRVDVIMCVDFDILNELPKYDHPNLYKVKKKTPNHLGKYEIYYELPKDKYGIDPMYKHYSVSISHINESVVIPLSLLESDYPHLIIDGTYCRGISDERVIRRELKLKSILNG